MSTAEPHASSSALAWPAARAFVIGVLLRALGQVVRSLALGWQLYDRTGSAWSLGFVGLVQVVPIVGMSLHAGAAADRWSRRTIGVVTNVVQVAVGLGLAAFSWTHAPVYVAYALLFISAIAAAFARPAMSAFLPELVPATKLAELNAWCSAVWELATIAGPIATGLVIARLGDASWLYVIDAVFSLVLTFVTLQLPAGTPHAFASPSASVDRLAGLRFVVRCPELLATITLDLLAALLGGVNAILPIFAKDVLHVGVSGLGWLRAASPAGAAVTMLLLVRLSPWRRPGMVMIASMFAFGCATLGFAYSRLLSLSLLCLFLCGSFDAVAMLIRHTLGQALAPARLRGRAFAIQTIFVSLSDELGEFESGATAAWLGATSSVVLGGVGTIVVVLVVAASARALRRLPPLTKLEPREALARAILNEDRSESGVS